MSIDIPLTKGFVTIVDDEDAGRVIAAGPWHAVLGSGARTPYAVHGIYRGNGRVDHVRLHTFLTGWPLVDHRNGDGLDNRRANLRPASLTENSRNARRRSDNTTGFKGVAWQARQGKYMAQIRDQGRTRFLGRYPVAEDAARAYDAAARELYGEFARLNFPADVEATR